MVRKLRAVFCALFGHARVYTTFMGYVSCARCGQQVGDTLAGGFTDKGGVSCSCVECEAAWKRLRWHERVMCTRPEWSHKTPAELEVERRADVARALASFRAAKREREAAK